MPRCIVSFLVLGSLLAITAIAALQYKCARAPDETDTRTLLPLNSAEQKAVRSEMRALLVSVSKILAALNDKDMGRIEATARKSGMAMAKQVEVSLKNKLTPDFMKLGKSVHVGFDTIADAARDGADQTKIIELLAQQTNRCTACHAIYGLK